MINASIFVKYLRQLSLNRVNKLIKEKAPDANNKQKNNTFITQIVYTF